MPIQYVFMGIVWAYRQKIVHINLRELNSVRVYKGKDLTIALKKNRFFYLFKKIKCTHMGMNMVMNGHDMGTTKKRNIYCINVI